MGHAGLRVAAAMTLAIALCAPAQAQDPAPATPEAAAPAAIETFDVWEYRVLGNSVLIPKAHV